MEEPGESKNLHAPAGHAEASGPQRRVFISYATADAAIAQKVCSALEAAGYPCWIAPRDVVPGTLYADGIVGAIDESGILVLILSKEAVASAHVGKELERATSKRHPIIALRTDSAPLNRAFEYFLNESQWIDVGAGGTDTAISKLVEAVGRHLAPGSAGTSTHTPQVPVSKAAKSRRVWGVAVVLVVLALVAGYFVVGRAWRHGHTAATVAIADKSIAVLPFVDMSEKKDQEYFGDGMAEEILDLLVKIPGLKVISRTSSFQFKGKTEDLRSIGTQLSVAYVLEGSVRKSGDRLRVTAQLIDSRNGTHLWSQTYDRDLSDVLKTQDDIAAQVARALQIEVSASDLVSRPALRNIQAYTLYLQATHVTERWDRQGMEQVMSDLQRALDLDPSFAEAASALADEYQWAGSVGFLEQSVAIERTRHFAELALKLDPTLVEPRALLGFIQIYEWNWPAAEQELKRARALAPNNTAILQDLAWLSLTLGRGDDALKYVNASLVVDPLEAAGYFWLSIVQSHLGRLPEAEASMRRALEFSPTSILYHYILGLILLGRSQPDAALTEILKEPDDNSRLAGSAMAYFALARKIESDAALAQLLKGHANHPFYIGLVYSFRGEPDETFKWLDRAYEQKDPQLITVKFEGPLNSLHGDPRYKAFLKKMNLPE